MRTLTAVRVSGRGGGGGDDVWGVTADLRIERGGGRGGGGEAWRGGGDGKSAAMERVPLITPIDDRRMKGREEVHHVTEALITK